MKRSNSIAIASSLTALVFFVGTLFLPGFEFRDEVEPHTHEQTEINSVVNENQWDAIDDRVRYDELDVWGEEVEERLEALEDNPPDDRETYYTLGVVNLHIEHMESKDELTPDEEAFLGFMKLYRGMLRDQLEAVD